MDLSRTTFRPEEGQAGTPSACATAPASIAGGLCLAAVIVLCAILVASGWIRGPASPVRLPALLPAMMPLTALVLALQAGGLLLWWRRPARGLLPSVAVASLGLLLLPETLGLPAGALLPAHGLSTATRAGLAWQALLLLMFGMRGSGRAIARWVPWPATAQLIAAYVVLYIHAFGLADHRQLPVPPDLSVPVAACFLLFALALMLLHPDHAWPKASFLPGPGGQLVRRFIAFGLIGPPGLSLVSLHLQERFGLGDSFDLSSAVMALVGSLAVTAALFAAAQWLERAARRQAETQMHLLRSSAEVERLKKKQIDAMSDRLDAIGRIAGGVAHDFNNMMAALQGNLELIDSMSTARPDQVRPLVQAGLASVARGDLLVRRLRSYAGSSALSPERFDAARALMSWRGRLAQLLPEHVLLHAPPPGAAGTVFLDRTTFQEAMVGLVSNARDAMPLGGQILLDVRETTLLAPEPCDETGREIIAPGRYVAVITCDTGPGFPEQMRDRLVEPFFTTKTKAVASGLGLSMVDGFCRQSKGYLRLQNARGGGAMVTMLFPQADRPEPGVTASPGTAES